MRIEPHRLGVDGDGRSEADTFGKITVVQLVVISPEVRHRARIGVMHPPNLVRPE